MEKRKKVRVYDVRLQVSNPLGKTTYKILYVGTSKKEAETNCADILTKNLVHNEVPKFHVKVSQCEIIKNNAIIFEQAKKQV